MLSLTTDRYFDLQFSKYNSQTSLFSLFPPVQKLFGRLTSSFFEPYRLADAVAEEVQLGPPDFAATDHFDLLDLRRVERELSLHAFVRHDPPHA